MPEPYSLNELKEMFITQEIFRKDIGKVYDKIGEPTKETIKHMDDGFQGIRDEIKPVCDVTNNHEKRLTALENEDKEEPEDDAIIPKRWRDSVWFKRGMFAGGLIVALLGGYGISLTGVGP